MAFNNKTSVYEGYIYIVTNTVNNKQYVGQTRRTVEKRWKEHLEKLKSDINYFHNSIMKYGKESYMIETLDTIQGSNITELTKKLNTLEIHYISKYNTVAPNGYNLTKGGDNNSINCDKPVEQYDKYGNYIRSYNSASEAAIAINGSRKGINNCCNRTVDKKNKRTYSSNGYIWRFAGDIYIQDSLDNSMQRPVIQYDMDGNIINSFDSIKNASIHTGIIPEAIGNCCNGKAKQCVGYVFLYADTQFVKPDNNRIKHVNCYDMNNIFVCEYPSIKEAALGVGGKRCGIGDCCRKRQLSAYGYKWFYVNDLFQPDTTKIKQVS